MKGEKGLCRVAHYMLDENGVETAAGTLEPVLFFQTLWPGP